jgi:16S rRNA (cytosine967-C5)-methyltransferase
MKSRDNSLLKLDPVLATAVRALVKIESQAAYANLVLEPLISERKLSAREASAVHRLVKGSLENLLLLDACLEPLLAKGLKSLPPQLRALLRVTVLRVLFLDQSVKALAVNQAVNAAKIIAGERLAKLTNAVLRKACSKTALESILNGIEEPVERMALRYSHPRWIVARWVNALGVEETESLCRANNAVMPLTLRANTLKISSKKLQELLAARDIFTTLGAYATDSLRLEKLPSEISLIDTEEFKDGLFMVQDESSTLVGELLNPHPGASVLDLCSAPGGKSTHLAALMQNRGSILAVDCYEHKLRLVDENCRRLGIRIVTTLRADGRQLSLDEQVDYVLLDAPCSGLGALGKRGDMRWHKAESSIEELSVLQRELLSHAAELIKVGGKIVYSTCTTEAEENESVVGEFLQEHSEFTLLPLADNISDKLRTRDGYLRTWPQQQALTGSFAALLQKVR